MTIPKVHIGDVVTELKGTNWGKLRSDLQAAMNREADCGTTKADGYPTSTLGGNGGGSGTSDPTSVAYQAREDARHDRLRSCTETAVRALIDAAAKVATCEKQLRNIADIVADAPITPKGCDLCTDARLEQDGAPIPWDHKGNVGGRLTRDLFLCGPHYYFVYNHGYEPTSDQTRHWWATGAWKIRLQTLPPRRLLA